MRHLLARWISIQDILIRVLEQFSNLKNYFLQVLPEQKAFKEKSVIESSERYIRIKTAPTDKKLPSIIAAVVYITKDFRNFTASLQDKLPMIAGLSSKIATLLKDSKFIAEENYLLPSKSLKPIYKLQKLGLNKEAIEKVLIR